MRVFSIGRLLFALGLIGIGVLSIFSGDFPYTWEPVPDWVAGRALLAHLSGILLVAGCAGILIKRAASSAALFMTIFLLGWVVVLQGSRVAQAPMNIGMWLGAAESTLLFTGSWILFAYVANPDLRARMTFLTSERGMRLARIFFGVACLLLGASHFVYTAATAGMVPAWLPTHTGFAYLTGAGHFAAGLGILFGVLPRLAATMEACMISLFVLLVHIPGAIAEPTSRLQWTMVFIATAYAGADWIVASSLRETSWGWSRTSEPRSSGPRSSESHPTLTVVRPPEQI